MISRDFTWIDETVEHDDHDYARAKALAARWSQLQTEEEERRWRRQADRENGWDYEPQICEDCEACRAEDYGQCVSVLAAIRRVNERQAERDLEIELVEDKLAAIGARMMRPYEHWHEDERLMEYMESRYDY